MKKQRIATIGLIAAASLALAAQKTSSFIDKAGSMNVTGLVSWRVSNLGGNPIKFQGKGNNIVAKWKTEGITIECRSINGSVVPEGKRFTIQDILAEGGVKVIRAKGAVTNSIAGETATVHKDGADAVIDVKNETTIDTLNTVTGGKLHATGSSCSTRVQNVEAAITSKQEPPYTTTLSGPVHFTYDQKGAKGTTHIQGHADKAVFEARRLRLIGNVVITGDSPDFSPNAEGDEATIELDSNGQPSALDVGPGTVTMTPKTGGNRR